jgi:hypothetical protein
MKELNIPFRLNMQFENWEFDLDFLPSRIKGHDSFKYRKKLNTTYFGNNIKKFELLFNADILTAVIINLNTSSLPLLVNLKKLLIENNKTEIIKIQEIECYKKGRYIYYVSENRNMLIYGKVEFMKRYISVFFLEI